MTANTTSKRIVSMDQFRGYTVAGMFLVNFVGGYRIVHEVLKHNDTYFSYADSILPSFIFAAGFSYRLTALRRLPQLGAWKTYRRYVLRSLALILVSIMIFGLNQGFEEWKQLQETGVVGVVAGLLKATLWEVLAIIGVCQLVIMPVIAKSARVRLLTLLTFLFGHVLLCYSFNFNWVYGLPTWWDHVWPETDAGIWDGGFFGIVAWSVAMLAGTLVYDLVSNVSSGTSARKLLQVGAACMLVGFAASCLTTLYNVDPSEEPTDEQLAASPVLPPFEKAAGRSFTSLLAEPPFVAPPEPKERKLNYWMMSKKIPSFSFLTFSTGFAIALYALFILACDVGSWQVGVFRTFGQNALAAYAIHEVVLHSLRPMKPEDAPLWWVAVSFAVFFAIVYWAARYMEKRGYYLRL